MGVLPDPRRLRILVVEDHRESAKALATLLAVLGHEVLVAERVDEALSRAEEATGEGRAPDLVISDLNLPDGTGWDLMQELGWRYGLRGIALSGYRRAADKRRSAEAGFVGHLVKPVSLEALTQSLADVADGLGSGAGAELRAG